MTPELRKQMEEMAEAYDSGERGWVRIQSAPLVIQAFKSGFTACSEIYEKELAALKEENKRLRDALMFYADTGNYCVIHPYNENNPKTFSPIIQDEGKIAKKALADSSQGKRCSHGMDLEYRCFICDPNIGVENRK